MDLERFEAMLILQSGRCEICTAEFTETPHVDHSHVTGRVRGLLCDSCNLGLGKFQDDPALLRLAAAYLERYDGPGTANDQENS